MGIFARLPDKDASRGVTSVERVQEVANFGCRPYVAALHFGKAKFSPVDHVYQLSDGDINLRHRQLALELWFIGCQAITLTSLFCIGQERVEPTPAGHESHEPNLPGAPWRSCQRCVG